MKVIKRNFLFFFFFLSQRTSITATTFQQNSKIFSSPSTISHPHFLPLFSTLNHSTPLLSQPSLIPLKDTTPQLPPQRQLITPTLPSNHLTKASTTKPLNHPPSSPPPHLPPRLLHLSPPPPRLLHLSPPHLLLFPFPFPSSTLFLRSFYRGEVR